MKPNMGALDRLVRGFVVGPVLVLVGLASGTSPFGIVAFVLAGVMFATGATGFCPLYVPFGLSTRGGISTHGRLRFGGRGRAVPQS